MRAKEFLSELGILGINGTGVVEPETVTITIPKELLNIDTQQKEVDETAEHESCRYCGGDCPDNEDYACDGYQGDIDRLYADDNIEQQDEDMKVTVGQPHDELADIVRLSRGEHRTPAAGQNHTIAAPATDEQPEDPLFISPLQQQLELQKQQGGKESPVINQIIDGDIGSTAGEQPEQSIYHDSPLEDNEWVGAGTGQVDNLRNRTTTKGATKPWYKL